MFCLFFFFVFFQNWINELRRNKDPQHCLKLERWQGPPHVNQVKQYETLSSFKVSLLIQFFQPWKQEDYICIIRLHCISDFTVLKNFTGSRSSEGMFTPLWKVPNSIEEDVVFNLFWMKEKCHKW